MSAQNSQIPVLKSAVVLTIACSCVLFFTAAYGEVSKAPNWKADREQRRYIYRSRPVRRDAPLRAENISDDEVREIQAVTAVVFPGAIANFSGVAADCPCEEGPMCDSQVWILAYRDTLYEGLLLSKIADEWVVGPIQTWWIEYDQLQVEIRRTLSAKAPGYRDTVQDLREKQYRLKEEFPSCDLDLEVEGDQ